MYKLKQTADDFRVTENPDFVILEHGKYPIYVLRKKNYTTEDALCKVADYLHIQTKFIGYAGIKDRKAVTEQYISVNVLKKQFNDLKLQDLELTLVGYNDEPVYVGRLKGNKFIITIRNLREKDIDHLKEWVKKKIMIPNLYGEQRFSKNNAETGKFMLKKNFENALKLILESKGGIEVLLKEYLENHPNDVVGALRKITLKIRKLYVHAYQSKLFNKVVKKYLKKNNVSKNTSIPIIGFGTEFSDKVIQQIYEEIMKKEGIALRDFIIRSMPELSSAGFDRELFIELKDFEILETGTDELNKYTRKAVVKFSLPKGCYGTVAVDFLLKR